MSFKPASIFLAERAPELLRHFNDFQYKIPKSHPKWGEISKRCAFVSMLYKDKYLKGDSPDDHVQAVYAHWVALAMWRLDQAPVYCLGLDLMRQFEQTDIDNLPSIVPEDWRAPLDMFMLIPPSNSLALERGGSVLYIMVGLKGRDQVASAPDRGIQASVMTTCGGTGNAQYSLDDWNLGSDPNLEALGPLAPLMTRVVSIALQSGLSLSYLPELVEDCGEEAKGFRPKKAAAEKSSTRYPRWIGKNFTRQKRPTNSTPGQSGITMTTHWRRGHWRQQPHGEGRQQRKLQWIQPTMINP